MSVVTNVILCIYGGPFNRSKYVNEFCSEMNENCFPGKAGFKPQDIGSLGAVVGGSKYPLGLILVSGFNYLNRDNLIDYLRKFDWKKFSNDRGHDIPLSVDLFWLHEDDEDGYKHRKIFRPKWIKEKN